MIVTAVYILPDANVNMANAVIKGSGGAIGLTEDPSALGRWMVSGPKISCLVLQYDAASGSDGQMKLREPVSLLSELTRWRSLFKEKG